MYLCSDIPLVGSKSDTHVNIGWLKAIMITTVYIYQIYKEADHFRSPDEQNVVVKRFISDDITRNAEWQSRPFLAAACNGVLGQVVASLITTGTGIGDSGTRPHIADGSLYHWSQCLGLCAAYIIIKHTEHTCIHWQ